MAQLPCIGLSRPLLSYLLGVASYLLSPQCREKKAKHAGAKTKSNQTFTQSKSHDSKTKIEDGTSQQT